MNNKYIKLYMEFLRTFVDVRKPLNIVLDCSNGTIGLVLKCLEIPNVNVTLLNSEPDGNFPAHDPSPLKEGATAQAEQAVVKQNTDFGVVFDADGDRAVFVDNNGRTVPAYVIARLLFDHHEPPYVLDLPTYYIMKLIGYEIIDKVAISRIGTRFIKEKMKERDASVGVEYSGHYYFSTKSRKDSFCFDSGILAVIKVMNAVSQFPHTLADFYDLLPIVYFSQFNIPLKQESNTVLSVLEKKFTEEAEAENRLDGLILEFKDWWFNVRPSHTEPLLRVSIAAKDQNTLKENEARIKKLIENT